jgi:hypothetical protein
MVVPALTSDDVRERLSFARLRQSELLALNGGDFLGADPHYRQQLTQEFFFHLVGAIEVLAQYVNEARSLGLSIEDVSPRSVIAALPPGDALGDAISGLYANTRPGRPVPVDPYSDDGVLYRIWNYRHQVTHRRRQPFQLNIVIEATLGLGGVQRRARWRGLFARRRPRPPDRGRSAHLILDPRQAAHAPSERPVAEELLHMLALVAGRCENALALA